MDSIEFVERYNGHDTVRTNTQEMPDFAIRWFFSTATNQKTLDEDWHPFDIMTFARFATVPVSGAVYGEQSLSLELQNFNPSITDEIRKQCDIIAKDIIGVVSQIARCHKSKDSVIIWRKASAKITSKPQKCCCDLMVKVIGFKKKTTDSGYGKMNRWEHNMETFLFLSVIVFDFPWRNQCISIDLREAILQKTGWNNLTEERIAQLNNQVKKIRKKPTLNISYLENHGWKWDGEITSKGRQQLLDLLCFEK